MAMGLAVCAVPVVMSGGDLPRATQVMGPRCVTVTHLWPMMHSGDTSSQRMLLVTSPCQRLSAGESLLAAVYRVSSMCLCCDVCALLACDA